MKIYAICAVLFFVPAVFGMFSQDFLDALLHINEEVCGRHTGASNASIEDARRNGKLPESPEMYAFAKCMLKVFKIIKDDGTVNPNVMSYAVPTNTPDITWKVSEKCKTLIGTDTRDTARKIFDCYLQEGQLVMASKPRL